MTSDDATARTPLTPLIAVPNVSEGRDEDLLERFRGVLEANGVAVLDVHSDAVHNRSVFTLAGRDEALVLGVTELARAALAIDLTEHSGVHPRLGALDVCPFVIEDEPKRAIDGARAAARRIAREAGLPVFLYGDAAHRDETRSLPQLRSGGLDEVQRRAGNGELLPDEGPRHIDPAHGVVCVGARRPLIAFNVWLRCDAEAARRIAAEIRSQNGGPPGVRALGWQVRGGLSQVSMNLVAPEETGIDDAFGEVARCAERGAVEIIATEIVGLPPERYLPDPKREAARLLLQPGRSLESVLRSRS